MNGKASSSRRKPWIKPSASAYPSRKLNLVAECGGKGRRRRRGVGLIWTSCRAQLQGERNEERQAVKGIEGREVEDVVTTRPSRPTAELGRNVADGSRSY